MKIMKFLTLIKLKNMYNEKVAEMLQKTYGNESFKLYCEMEIKANELLTNEVRRVQGHDDFGYDYDAFWWKDRLSELLNKENY